MIVERPLLGGRRAAGDAGVDELDAALARARRGSDASSSAPPCSGRRRSAPVGGRSQHARRRRTRRPRRPCCRAARGRRRRPPPTSSAIEAAGEIPTPRPATRCGRSRRTGRPASRIRRAIRPPMLPRPIMPLVRGGRASRRGASARDAALLAGRERQLGDVQRVVELARRERAPRASARGTGRCA